MDGRIPSRTGEPPPTALADAPTGEFAGLAESPAAIRNVGWTLGQRCPCRCEHCHSARTRGAGRELTRKMVDRLVARLVRAGVETVNLGGNEPLFSGGASAEDGLLAYVIESVAATGMAVGLTTNGLSLLDLHERHPDAFRALNDVDVSLDSPFAGEHDRSRGLSLHGRALASLELCSRAGKPHAVAYCAMGWNFDRPRLDALVEVCRRLDADLRVNPFKPVGDAPAHLELSPDAYFAGFAHLLARCETTHLGEPSVAAAAGRSETRRCPCGRTSLRIHAPTAAGEIFASPCVYLPEYRAPLDLLEHELAEVASSPQFRVMRQRHCNPRHVEGCAECRLAPVCGGGCAAQAFLHARLRQQRATLRARTPYCPADRAPEGALAPGPPARGERLVHVDYLCTWIGRPRPGA